MKLIITSEGSEPQEFTLEEAEASIGRQEDSRIVLEGDPSVSRRHALITKEGNRYFIEDLGSLNGTRVNHLEIAKKELFSGDVIEIGSTQLVFAGADAHPEKPPKREPRRAHRKDEDDLTVTIRYRVKPSDVPKIEKELDSQDIASLQNAYRRLTILYNAFEELGRMVTLKTLFDRVLRLVTNTFKADYAFIFLTEGKDLSDERLTPDYVHFQGGVDQGGADVLSRAIIDQVCIEGQAILTDNALADDRFVDSKSISMKKIRSVICTPIMLREAIIGMIQVGSFNQLHGFCREDLELLAALSNGASIAIENVRLLDDLRAVNQELRDSQRQLTEAAKFSALGVMASGMVHEIRSPLSAIAMATEAIAETMAMETPEEKSRQLCQKSLDLIVNRTRHCTQIVNNLLAFARRRETKMVPVQINDAIEAALLVSRFHVSKFTVTIEGVLAEGLPRVSADPTQIQQVFLNIIVNAMDAMGEKGGVLRIRSSRSDDGFVVAEFTDTGAGIEKQHLPEIFEPLFSTKEEGTGLGLSISKKIIEHHGGQLGVESTPGNGATFTIRLPALDDGDQTVSARPSV